jgi:glutathione S-transferase
VLLALSGDDWADERVPGAKWGAIKPTTRYGQMPVLTCGDGRVLTQSRAIARYLAKSVTVQGQPLYPEDAWLAYQVDEYIEALEDVRAKLGRTFAIKDQKEKEAARAALFATDGTGEVFEGLKRIEGLISPGGCMVGESVTLADAWLFAVVNQFRCGFLDGVPRDGWMEGLPKLQAVVAKVGAVPKLRAHYEKHADVVAVGKKIHTVFLE